MVAKGINKYKSLQLAVWSHYVAFIKTMHPDTEMTEFHTSYYRVLDAFARGKIRKLIISMPPQHGKSFGATENLPAYILGLDPDLRIAITSYNSTLAERFCRRNQRVMDSVKYRVLFPNTQIGEVGDRKIIRKGSEFEIADSKGGVIAVGTGGPLTGNKVDIAFMDDLYKDYKEGNSPTVRDNVWDWYVSVVRTRLHNSSQQLAVFTRWHEEDVIGRLLESENCVEITDLDQIDDIDPDTWAVLTFKALKEGEPTTIDPRSEGEALWSSRHSEDSLRDKEKLDPNKFQALYQQNPTPSEGLMYDGGFREYEVLPSDVVRRVRNVTDTASSGDNYFCSICYVETKTGMYVTDLLFTAKNTDYTVPKCAEMIQRNGVVDMIVESNNGGREIAQMVKRTAIENGYAKCRMNVRHQSENKELRIRVSAPDAQNLIHFPKGWDKRWPEFANQLKGHRYVNSYNRYDDAADGITYMVENFGKRDAKIIMI